MAEAIRYEVTGAVARITIDLPEHDTALGPPEWRALQEAIDRASADEIRVLVIMGAGGSLSAKGDGAAILRDLRELAAPSIALIDGHATGAGLALALACDLRVASSRARFSAALQRGTVAGDLGGVSLLRHVIGAPRALELLLLTEEIDAAEALRIGLVHRVYQVDLFQERCEEIIERVAALPTAAVALTSARAPPRRAHGPRDRHRGRGGRAGARRHDRRRGRRRSRLSRAASAAFSGTVTDRPAGRPVTTDSVTCNRPESLSFP